MGYVQKNREREKNTSQKTTNSKVKKKYIRSAFCYKRGCTNLVDFEFDSIKEAKNFKPKKVYCEECIGKKMIKIKKATRETKLDL